MGMYTAISFRLKVRKNTPLPVYATGDFGPLCHIRITEEEEFTPPWTLQELRAGEKEKRLEEEARIEQIRKEGGGFGFGGW